MQHNEQRPKAIVSICAPSDIQGLERWETHLRPLEQAGIISAWSVCHLPLGADRGTTLHDHLDQADIIILLLSADFFTDDECCSLLDRALARHQQSTVRVIPLLLRPVAYQETKLATLAVLPSSGSPVTQWHDPEAAFDDCVRELRRILGRPVTAPLTQRKRSLAEEQNRTRMLKRVRTIWIDGLLQQSLHRAAWIDLHLREQPDAVSNPWRFQVQELGRAPHPLPAGTSIVQVYDEASSELLILGEPGSGKTTLLLELTRTLLERAEKDERLPIPIVFNLSSWAEKRQQLRLWLLEELRTKYYVPRKVGQNWLDADEISPLLDGLDEVSQEARSACVEMINNYYQSQQIRGRCSIVVCCRSEEYASLSTRVKLERAVSILPLTNEQINTYLEQAGEQVKGLTQSLNEDAELYSLARQPLMLNILTLAYQRTQASEVPSGETREGTRHTVFAKYVERMLNRRKKSKYRKPEQVILWLTFLAKRMQQHNQIILSVENLQPTWLSRRERTLSQWCVGLLFGLFDGLLFGLFCRLFFGSFFGLILGSIGGLPVGLVVGLATGLDTKIDPAEALIWSWKNIGSGLTVGLAVGLIAGWFSGLTFGLAAGTVAGLVSWLVTGLSGRRLERLSLSPNEGIWRSGRNGLIVGLIVGLVTGLAFWLIAGLTFGLAAGLVIGLLFRLRRGLDAFVKHFLLRFFLMQQGDLPWNLIGFLDEAARRLLLRKVGGSYIFVHRQLLDYFASLDESATVTNTSSEDR